MAHPYNSSFSGDCLFFAFLNANHAKTANILLNNDISSRGLDIIFIYEPYYSDHGIAFFDRKFKSIFYPQSPRTAIIIANSAINFTVLDLRRDLIVLNLDFKGVNYLFINSYIPPSKNISNQLSIIEPWFIKYSNKKIIVLGNFNTKHPIWGGHRTDSRGETLLDFINYHDFNILNEASSPPTFDSTIGQSWIDLAFSKNFDDNVLNFKVHDDISLSDHRLITFNLVYRRVKTAYNRMNLKNTNKWKLVSDISHLLDSKTLDLNIYDSNYVIDTVTKNVNQLYRNNVIRNFKRKKDAPWWDSSLDIERKRVRALRRKYQSETDITKRINYMTQFKMSRAKYKKSTLYKKCICFKSFVSNITTSGTFGSAYKIVKDGRKSNCLCDMIQKADGTFTDN